MVLKYMKYTGQIAMVLWWIKYVYKKIAIYLK